MQRPRVPSYLLENSCHTSFLASPLGETFKTVLSNFSPYILIAGEERPLAVRAAVFCASAALIRRLSWNNMRWNPLCAHGLLVTGSTDALKHRDVTSWKNPSVCAQLHSFDRCNFTENHPVTYRILCMGWAISKLFSQVISLPESFAAVWNTLKPRLKIWLSSWLCLKFLTFRTSTHPEMHFLLYLETKHCLSLGLCRFAFSVEKYTQTQFRIIEK